jgi:hypothetical protein
MSCADKKIALIEKKMRQLRAEIDGNFGNASTYSQWTTLNTHLSYLKKNIELDKSIAETEEKMRAALDIPDESDDRAQAYEKWAELNTELNKLTTLKTQLEEEEIESKAIDAILKAEVKLYYLGLVFSLALSMTIFFLFAMSCSSRNTSSGV